MFYKIKILLLVLFIINCKEGKSQTIAFENEYSFGQVIKHSKKMLHMPTQPTQGFHISFKKITQGDQRWKIAYQFPEVGIGASCIKVGNAAVYGYVLGVYPTFSRFIFNRPKHQVFLSYSSGLAMHTRPFDVITNPYNTAIGSYLNNITILKIEYLFKLFKQTSGVFALSLIHTSNGSLQLPNLGLNIVSAHVGLRFTDPIKPKIIYSFNDLLPYNSSLVYFGRISIGANERNAIGGPKYPIYGLSAGISKQVSMKHKWLVGADVEYNLGISDQIKYNENNFGNPNFAPLKAAVFAGHEFLVNRFGIQVSLGYYVYKKAFKPLPLYTKVGAFQYFKIKKNSRYRAFGGVILKTHFGTAELVEVTTGIQF
jgi:hypothetical protein